MLVVLRHLYKSGYGWEDARAVLRTQRRVLSDDTLRRLWFFSWSKK